MVNVFSEDRLEPETSGNGDYWLNLDPVPGVMTATLTNSIMPQSMNNVETGRNIIRIRIQNVGTGAWSVKQYTIPPGLYSEDNLRTLINTWLTTYDALEGTNLRLAFDAQTEKETFSNTGVGPANTGFSPWYSYGAAALRDGPFASPVWTLLGFSTAQIYADVYGSALLDIEAENKYNGGHKLTALYICCEQLCNEKQVRYSSHRMEEYSVVAVMPMDPTVNSMVFAPTASQQITFDLSGPNGRGVEISELHIRLLGRLSNEEMYVVNFNGIPHHMTFVLGVRSLI